MKAGIAKKGMHVRIAVQFEHRPEILKGSTGTIADIIAQHEDVQADALLVKLDVIPEGWEHDDMLPCTSEDLELV